YNIVGGVNFYSRREIKDILAYLKTIDNGKDDLAVKRIINVPKRGIGAASITKVQGYADYMGISFFEALEHVEEIPSMGKGKAAEKLKSFALMIRMFRTKLSVGNLEDLITDVIETTGYVQELEASDEEDAKDRIENIDELITKLVSFEMEKEKLGEEATLSGFLEEVALVADIDNVNKDDNKVLLMTVHSAKGLEFSQVYLSGLEDGVFPSYMTITSDDPFEVEEERRLAYVGITRAKDDLTISYAKSRMIRGETQYNRVSRFVGEIPAELMDNRPYSAKRRDDTYAYEEDSFQKNIFKTKPFQTGQNNWLEAAAYLQKQERASAAKLDDTVFDLPPSAQENTRQERVQTAAAGKKNFSEIVASKPKAVVRKKETPAENKPYISKSLAGLTKG
ncbi:MAG: ATP-dependent DNA helicase PcrA, partial [Lachnospiraceae bacterium]|nr:ATP-dependent DNA helicase PcrA [Lachnospiraceae bacterium]